MIPDKTVGISRPDTVLTYMEIRTAFVIDTAVPMTHNIPKTEAEKITKCDNFALETKNIWKHNNASAYPLVISAEGVVTENLLKYLENIGWTENILTGVANSSNCTNASQQYAKS